MRHEEKVGTGTPRVYKDGAKVRAFFAALKGPAKGVVLEAARMAGYSNPRAAGQMLKAKWPGRYEQALVEYSEQFKVGDGELEGLISDIARDKAHRDQLKALELIARMKGKFNDKIQVNIDRKATQKELEEVLAAVRALGAEQLQNNLQNNLRTTPEQPDSKQVSQNTPRPN